MLNDWYKNEETDKIWWKETETVGEWIFSFDKKTEYNMFADYPHNLTPEQKEVFDKENPEWVEYFEDRQSAPITGCFFDETI